MTLSVAIIRARYNPLGGAERFVERVLTALASGPIALSVIARRWPPGTGDTETVRMIRVDPFHVGSWWRDASFAAAVGRHLRAHHYDLVQSHERIPGVMLYRAGDGVHAEFLAQRLRGLGALARMRVRLNPFHRYVLRTERRMFEHPALRRVICNSVMVRDEIARRFSIDPDKLVVIRNGVDLERFAPADPAGRVAARGGFGLAPDVPVFAHVGAGFERKGVAVSLRALADPRAPADAHLLVAGTDKRIGRYQSLARSLGVEGRVHWLGGVADVRPVLHAADAFVMPTIYDPFPNAALEALACGLPVITSHKCGVAELIEPGRNGELADALDAPAVADAMRRLADPQGADDRRRAAREAVLPWSLTRMGADMMALYRELGTELSSPP